MRKKILIITSGVLYSFFVANIAYAYLDPGTGSIILQAIIGFLAASATAISIYWHKFKSLIFKILGKKKKIKKENNNSSDD